MELVLVMLLLCLAVTLIASPLIWRSEGVGGEDAELGALEAAKEAKFREIRDAELDFRTGKLSREDFKAVDTTLRAEAIDLLRRLDALREERRPALSERAAPSRRRAA
jgi:hypothetical protein